MELSNIDIDDLVKYDFLLTRYQSADYAFRYYDYVDFYPGKSITDIALEHNLDDLALFLLGYIETDKGVFRF